MLIHLENSGRGFGDPIKLVNPINNLDTALVESGKMYRISNTEKKYVYTFKITELVFGVFLFQYTTYKKVDTDEHYVVQISDDVKKLVTVSPEILESVSFINVIQSGCFGLDGLNRQFFSAIPGYSGVCGFNKFEHLHDESFENYTKRIINKISKI